MKPFIVKIALFILLFLIVLTPFCLYRRNQLQTALQKEAILPAGTTTLVLGDSHTETALDPAYFEGMANRSKSAETMFYSYIKLKYYIENNPTLKQIIFSFNYFRLGEFSSDRIFGDKIDESYPIYMPILSLFTEECKPLFTWNTYKSLIMYYFINSFGIPTKDYFNDLFLKRNSLLTFQGGFIDTFKADLEKIDLPEEMKKHYETYNPDNPNAYFGDFESTYFHKFISYATERGIKVVLFNTPSHPKYNEHIPEPIMRITDSIAVECEKQYGISYINMIRYQLPDSLFRDDDHINTLGAAVITPILRDSLIQLGVIENK